MKKYVVILIFLLVFLSQKSISGDKDSVSIFRKIDNSSIQIYTDTILRINHTEYKIRDDIHALVGLTNSGFSAIEYFPNYSIIPLYYNEKFSSINLMNFNNLFDALQYVPGFQIETFRTENFIYR